MEKLQRSAGLLEGRVGSLQQEVKSKDSLLAKTQQEYESYKVTCMYVCMYMYVCTSYM